MKITVKVKTGKKENEIIRKDNQFFINLKSKPIKGQANAELVQVLSDYYKKPKTDIKIVCGEKSRSKIIEIS